MLHNSIEFVSRANSGAESAASTSVMNWSLIFILKRRKWSEVSLSRCFPVCCVMATEQRKARYRQRVHQETADLILFTNAQIHRPGAWHFPKCSWPNGSKMVFHLISTSAEGMRGFLCLGRNSKMSYSLATQNLPFKVRPGLCFIQLRFI